MNFLEAIRSHLDQPEYLHVLVNPMPVYGLAMGVLALVAALILRHRTTCLVALGLVFIGGASAYPTYVFGEQGYDRVRSMSDGLGEKWIDAHKARAEKLIPLFYVAAAAAAAAALVPIKWPKTALPLALATLLIALGTLAAGGYIAMAGGQVRHKEFRTGDPPPESAQATQPTN